MPPMGQLLSPFRGIWMSHRSQFERVTGEARLALPGLNAPVVIRVDQDQVKHIFAQNDEDLYFAQGFVVATDRLWQMDFVARLAGGRLSQMVGPRALDIDRIFTKMGLPQAAADTSTLMLADPTTARPLIAYAKGVNAYISSLTPETLPFEYRLLGFTPEEWKPEKAALLLKFMAYNLAGFSNDLTLSRSFNALSPEDFKDLFPLDLPIPEPIAPRETKWHEPSSADPAVPKNVFHPNVDKLPFYPNPDPSNGSNNWAVSGKKSVTGLPILSNDVHLQLSLPALFYEMQLVSPTQNVYGATLPGSPGIILGFNQHLAWGVTNAGADVLDWYELRYRDERKSEYVFDGNWRPVISREVQIPVRGQASVGLLLRSTHLGPIVYDEGDPVPKGLPTAHQIPKGLALRWAVLMPSNELHSFLALNHASSTAECRKAIETFDSPGQNFICADADDDIGIWHMGRFPIRYKGQGRMIVDGTSKDSEWRGWIPRNELPFSRNPERGFVSSANQAPADADYPHYLGWPYENPFRAMRINEILREKKKFSPEEIVQMQGDTLSIPARELVPVLVRALEAEVAGGLASHAKRSLSRQEEQAVLALKNWDFRFDQASVGATVFTVWWNEFYDLLWSPRFPNQLNFMRPPMLRTIDLVLHEPESKWFDNPMTSQHETMNGLAFESFERALTEIEAQTGTSTVEKWKWNKFQPTQLTHLARFPGLSDTKLVAPGSEFSIFANTGHHGPAWKMVVALGDKPQAWGLYPGGQSGDPASPHYDDFFEAWAENKMRPLNYLSSVDDLDNRQISIWRLEASPGSQADSKNHDSNGAGSASNSTPAPTHPSDQELNRSLETALQNGPHGKSHLSKSKNKNAIQRSSPHE